MKKSLSPIALLVLTALPAALAGDAPAKAGRPASPMERIEKALQMPLAKLDGNAHALGEMLQLFGKITNENFILDPTLPKSVGETKVLVRVKDGGTVLDAFGFTLAQVGLRYALLDGAVFVSTEGKLADRLLSGSDASEPLTVGAARAPMTVGDAVVRSQPFDPYQDDFLDARDFISHAPWRFWEPPRYNPKTGLTDFPGPPVWIESPQVGHPRFRYTGTPYFLKPEYLAYEQEKREYRDDQDRQERAERQANVRALSAILQLLKDNPDMKADEILKKLGKDK